MAPDPAPPAAGLVSAACPRSSPGVARAILTPFGSAKIMLQQTQVATVERYFPVFCPLFPPVAALATSPEQKILRLWEGLGYYRRARQLHAAAKKIVADHNGQLPRRSRIVAAITWHWPLHSRGDSLHRLRSPGPRFWKRIPSASCAGYWPSAAIPWLVQEKLSSGATAEELLPQHNASQFNQALMELGSLDLHTQKSAVQPMPARVTLPNPSCRLATSHSRAAPSADCRRPPRSSGARRPARPHPAPKVQTDGTLGRFVGFAPLRTQRFLTTVPGPRKNQTISNRIHRICAPTDRRLYFTTSTSCHAATRRHAIPHHVDLLLSHV